MTILANICMDVVRAVGHDLPLFCADFLFLCCYSVYESVGEVLKLTAAAAHKFDVFGKSQIA